MGKIFQDNCTEKKINTMHSTCAHSWAWLTLPGLHGWLGTLAPSLLTSTECGRWSEKLHVWKRSVGKTEPVCIRNCIHLWWNFPFNPGLFKLCYHRHREQILTLKKKCFQLENMCSMICMLNWNILSGNQELITCLRM